MSGLAVLYSRQSPCFWQERKAAKQQKELRVAALQEREEVEAENEEDLWAMMSHVRKTSRFFPRMPVVRKEDREGESAPEKVGEWE